MSITRINSSFSELSRRQSNRFITRATELVRFYFEACGFALQEISNIISGVSGMLIRTVSNESSTKFQSSEEEEDEIETVQKKCYNTNS